MFLLVTWYILYYNGSMKTDLWNYLKTTKKPIVLYGMGNGADKIIKVLESRGIAIKGVFASDGFVRKKFFHGFELISYNEAKEQFQDMIVLLCFGSALPDVIENIKSISSEQELYAPDVPVCEGALFDIEYYNKNKDVLESVCERLEDELSKKTFTNTINYKLSGDLSYLFDCEVSPNEPYNSFFKLTDDEIFIDLGAYRGDTVIEFISRVESYRKIIAIEPDFKTFNKLLIELEGVKNLTAVNACASSTVGERLFFADGSRGSKVSGEGKRIDSVTVDSLVGKEGCTYIKMDIEGEELSAIKGAEHTIKTYKPKMLISCYHKSEDLLKIPKAVLSIRDDYKIYMRHFPSVPSWDTVFYFV